MNLPATDKPTVPIFLACDARFLRYGVVTLASMMEHAAEDRSYAAYFLHADIPADLQAEVTAMARENFSIAFEDVTDYLDSIADKLPLRDYYSKTTYYRLFIAEMHPEFSKAIYIDCDTVVQADPAELYDTDLAGAWLAACHEQAMVQVDEYGDYVERVLGVSRHNFFNAGVLLLNCEELRMHFVLDKFIHFLNVYDFVVTQDEDYLNLICKDHVLFLDQRWNTEVFGEIPYPIEEAKVIHYIMVSKPWHYKDCRFGEIFHAYAKKTKVYPLILEELEGYTDEQKARDAESVKNLLALAVRETNNENNYLNLLNREKRATDRVEILKRIEDYEREGRFDEDVENDPPTKPLLPDDIDYFHRGAAEALKRKVAFSMARNFLNRMIAEKKFIIKEIVGIEHFKALGTGAVITCNHFNALDSFAIQMAYEAAEQKNRSFFRVIREGNYTSFPGFYGFLMRHCNTLPLSSNHRTMHKFTEAAETLLREGHFVLVYPEQSMWWNYRKPKPLKDGAFLLAAKSGVPVLPCFITMQDSDILGEDGFYVQEYTIHVSPPIYPDAALEYRDRIADLRDRNYDVWREIYERVYQLPLTYLTEQKPTGAV